MTCYVPRSSDDVPSGPGLPAAGRLFFVVGASGVGKDSLLRWVERHITTDDRIVCARRTITRPADASEAYEPTDDASFRQLAAEGHFAMFWQAHNLCYGIPRGIYADLAAGYKVVINGSREYLPQLRRLFPDAIVIWVEADAKVIRQRLQLRQREDDAALAERLARAARYAAPDDAIRLDNSGPIEIAGRRLLQLLKQH
jgi:ribose 1,5-bisphosphokinase